MSVSEADIRRIALDQPGAYEQKSYGNRPSWRTKHRMFAWIPEQPYGLVLWVDSLETKNDMLASDSRTFFTTGHYDAEPIVIVDLATIDIAQLAALIHASWKARAQ